MRDMMRDDRFEELHGKDLVAMRLWDRQFAEEAIRDRKNLYPILTGENAGEAIDYQSNRVIELRNAHVGYQAALARVTK
jgi:hypothetical protein